MRRFVLPILLTSMVTLGSVFGGPKPAKAEFGHYDWNFNVFTWRITQPEKPLAEGEEPEPSPSVAIYDPFAHGKTDYLVGTMHFPVKPDEEDVPSGLKKILEVSTAFEMEADLTKFSRTLVQPRLSLASGQNLQVALPPAVWKTLADSYAAKGVPPGQLAHYKPWLLELMWANKARMGNGLDSYLKTFAADRAKKVYFLESMTEQIKALDAGTFEERMDMLAHSVNDPQMQVETLQAMLDSYKAGYLESSRGLVFDEEMMRRYPVYYRQLFDDRNKLWLPRITDTFAKEDAVVAVGLGHLIGPNGLLKMLKDRGYTIERVPFDN